MKVKCILPLLNDLEANTMRKLGEIFEVTEERAKYLAGANPSNLKAVEIIEKIKLDGKEIAEKVKEIVEQPKKEEKVVKKPVKKVKNVSRETKKKK